MHPTHSLLSERSACTMMAITTAAPLLLGHLAVSRIQEIGVVVLGYGCSVSKKEDTEEILFEQRSVEASRVVLEQRFWAIREGLQITREVLGVLALTALVLYFVVALINGHIDASPELLRGGSGFWLR